MVDEATIDVVIPTIGRKKYLYDVLCDLRKQTHLPKNVIIVEQNLLLDSKSELDFLQNDDEINANGHFDLSPIPIEGLPVPEKWNYYEWRKQNGNVKIIFMPFIQVQSSLHSVILFALQSQVQQLFYPLFRK